MEQPESKFEFVLGQRQMAALLFVLVSLSGVFGTLTFIAGKAIAGRESVATASVPSHESTIFVRCGEDSHQRPNHSGTGEGILVPVSAPAGSQQGATAAAPVPPPAPSSPCAQHVSLPEAKFADPVPPGVYLQMGAVDRGMATVFVQYLAKLGFPALIAPGPDDKTFRVLLGPVSEAAVPAIRANLAERGFTSFPKRYQAH